MYSHRASAAKLYDAGLRIGSACRAPAILAAEAVAALESCILVTLGDHWLKKHALAIVDLQQ